MSEEDRVRWDERYATRADDGRDDIALPDVFVGFAEHLPVAGNALDLACGPGAHSVWLAQRGLHVHGVDVSPVAIAQARRLAETAGVARCCRFEVFDLDAGLPPGPQVDVLLCNMFRDSSLDEAVMDRLARGGMLMVSALSEVGSDPGPFRVRPGELPRAFAPLEVLHAGESDGRAWLVARSP